MTARSMNDVESELAELHRKYKIMETDRKVAQWRSLLTRQAYTEDSQSVIRKQRETIDKLKQSNEQLKVRVITQHTDAGDVKD